jgi:hypothetical protein
MTSDDPQLREAVRAIADRAEANAAPPEAMAARIEARLQRQVPALGLVALVAVALLLAVGLRLVLASPDTGGGTPTLDGIYRSAEPREDGTCVAVRFYDTTPSDGRVALWSWTAAAPSTCRARSSNLFTAVGSAQATELPDGGAGWRLQAAPGTSSPLADVTLVVDASAARDQLSGYWSPQEMGGGEPTLRLDSVDVLDVPYQPR